MNRAQRIGLVIMIIALYFAIVRFGTDNPRIEFCYGTLSYLFLIVGTWELVNGKDDKQQ